MENFKKETLDILTKSLTVTQGIISNCLNGMDELAEDMDNKRIMFQYEQLKKLYFEALATHHDILKQLALGVEKDWWEIVDEPEYKPRRSMRDSNKTGMLSSKTLNKFADDVQQKTNALGLTTNQIVADELVDTDGLRTPGALPNSLNGITTNALPNSLNGITASIQKSALDGMMKSYYGWDKGFQDLAQTITKETNDEIMGALRKVGKKDESR